MTIKDIINAEPSLQKLLAISLPVKTAYKLSKLVNKLQPELDIFNKQRNKLIEELGEEKDGQTTVKPENLDKFQKEITKLTEIEVKLEFGDGKEFEKISVEDLGDVKLEARDLVTLSFLLND